LIHHSSFIFCGLLEAEDGLAPVAPVGMAAGKQCTFGNEHAVLVAADFDFRDWDNHYSEKPSPRERASRSSHTVTPTATQA